MKLGDKLFWVGCPAVLLSGWLLIGVVYTWDMHEDYSKTVFLKRSPTFRFAFYNPYASDRRGAESEYLRRMDANGDWLPGTPELDDYLAYCKARYAIDLPDPIEARKRCRLLARATN